MPKRLPGGSPEPAATSTWNRLQGTGALVAAVLLLALTLRLAAVLWLSDTIPYSDYFYYHEAGRMQARDWTFLFQHETVQKYGKLSWWPPGYPVFLAAVYSLFGARFRAAVLLQVGMGTLVCGLTYAVGARAAGRRAGTLAALLVALDPTFVFTTNLIASENLYAVWLVLGMWLAGRAWRSAGPKNAGTGMRTHVWTGVVLALGTLTRAIGLMLPFVVAAWMRQRAPSRPAWRRTSAWLLAGFALTLAPWTLRNAVVAGSPALVCFGGGLNFYFGHNDDGLGYREVSKTPMAGLKSAAAIDRRGYELGLQNLTRDPLGFFAHGVRKIGSLFAPPTYALHANSAILVADFKSDPTLEPLAKAALAEQHAKDRWLHGPLAVLAAVHTYLALAGALLACFAMRRRLPDELQLSMWICAYWIAAHVVFWAQPRFRYPMEIPLALLAAFALVNLGELRALSRAPHANAGAPPASSR